MLEYVDSCRTLEILKQDSGLLPKPREDWNVFVPKKGDVARVDADNCAYGFNGTEWIRCEIDHEHTNCQFNGDEWVIVEEDEETRE